MMAGARTALAEETVAQRRPDRDSHRQEPQVDQRAGHDCRDRAPPPAASTASAANCDAPANASADIAIGASGPSSGRAVTPKDKGEQKPGNGERTPARIPAAYEPRLSRPRYPPRTS